MQSWNNTINPIATVQIIKSVNSPYQRYNKLAEILNKNGYLVFCNKKSPRIGDVFTKTINQETKTMNKIKERFELPLFLIGHGFGGFVAQKIISNTNRCDGAICNAGGEDLSILTHIQCTVITWICRHAFGRDANAKLIPQIYKHDNGITYNHTYWMLKGMKNKESYKNIPKPQLFICGKHDIIGANKRMTQMLYNTYSKYDLHKLSFVLYPDIKNPIESPENWKNAQNDIIQFLNEHAHRAQ